MKLKEMKQEILKLEVIGVEDQASRADGISMTDTKADRKIVMAVDL